MIDRARTLAARAGRAAEYLVATAESLPFEDDAFDVVVSRLVFHHLPGDLKTRALGEMARVLQAGRTAARRRHGLADGARARITSSPTSWAPIRTPGTLLERLVCDAGFTQLTSGRLMHGMLAGVAARSPERGAQE